MKRMVSTGEKLEGVVFKTSNVIIQQLKKGRGRCVFIGPGTSLSVTEEDIITLHDPGMTLFKNPKCIKDATFVFYYPFECKGLREAAKDIADFINNTLEEAFEQVLLIGHSKSGICVSYVKEEVIRKSYSITISTPFEGTLAANKLYCEKKLKNPIFIKGYNKVFSNHNVDKEIVPNSEVIEEVREMNFEVDFNIRSEIKWIWECTKPIEIVVLFFGKLIGIKGDGIVSISSQKACKSKRNETLRCSHVTSLQKGIELYFNNEFLWRQKE